MENRILLIISIILSSIMSFLLARGFYLMSINLGLFLLIFLVSSLIKEAKDKIKLHKMLLQTYNNALDNGIDLNAKSSI